MLKSEEEVVEKNKALKSQCSKKIDLYWTMLVHDMKGPIQAELSAIKLLLSQNHTNLNESQIEILESLLNSTEYLNNLVSNVLEKCKCENGNIQLDKHKYSFKKFITECCDEIKYIALDKNVVIKVLYKTKIEEINFDYFELKRVVLNLLTNALKYSYKNSEILISISDKDKNIIVELKNSGIGIDEENQKIVFNKFTSFCENHMSVNIGLGLYVSKQIINTHGGTIRIESVPQKYTKVTFTLPV